MTLLNLNHIDIIYLLLLKRFIAYQMNRKNFKAIYIVAKKIFMVNSPAQAGQAFDQKIKKFYR